jgi:hypothetical protein
MEEKRKKVMQKRKEKGKDSHWSFSKRDPAGPGLGG